MMQDKYPIFGGPYDGEVVDWIGLYRTSTLLPPYKGDFGLRQFVLVSAPLQPDGGNEDGPYYLYERVECPDGVRFELRTRQALDEASRQTRLKIDPRAKSALLTLPDEFRRAALDVMTELDRKDPQFWPADKARKLSDEPPLYLANLPGDFRAFIRVTETGQLELADIAREATIRWFVEQYHKARRADETVR